MKTAVFYLKSAFLFLVCAGMAHAVPVTAVYTFSPTPIYMTDFEGNYAYSWRLDWNLPADRWITNARLYIAGLNRSGTTADLFHIHMLDNPPIFAQQVSANVTRGSDVTGSDAFAGQGVLLADYDDLNGAATQNLSINFTADQLGFLREYLADGVFGFGFDPDSFYCDTGIQFLIQTTLIPEPATLALCLAGLGLGGIIRRRAARRIH